MNIRESFEQQVERNPEKVYLYFQDQEVTYKALDRRTNQVANGFLESGIRKGDKVSLLLPNCPEFLYLWFGLNKIGAVLVPINLALKEGEITYIVNHSEAKAVVLQNTHRDILEKLRKECTGLEMILMLGDPIPETIHSNFPKNRMGRVMKEVLKQERPDLTKGCYDKEKQTITGK